MPLARPRQRRQVGGKGVDDVSGMGSADAVVLMLPTSAIVDQVLHGANGGKGLLDYLPPDQW